MSHVPQAELAHDLRVACMRVARRVRYEASGLAPHLMTTLAGVEHGPRTATDLAADEQVAAASMSRTVAELEQRGLIARAADDADRRTRPISITEAGARELAANRAQRDGWMLQRLGECTAEERRVLAEAAAILERMTGGRR